MLLRSRTHQVKIINVSAIALDLEIFSMNRQGQYTAQEKPRWFQVASFKARTTCLVQERTLISYEALPTAKTNVKTPKTPMDKLEQRKNVYRNVKIFVARRMNNAPLLLYLAYRRW